MSKHLMHILRAMALASPLVLLAGCGGGGGDVFATPGTTGGTSTDPSTTVSVASLSISTDKSSIKTNDADAATIKVIAKDSSNAGMSDVTIGFSVDGDARLSASSVTTDSSGAAEVKLYSGPSYINTVVNVQASVPGTTLSKSIPIQVAGSTAVISAQSNQIEIGATTQATVTVRNGNDQAVNAAEVCINTSNGSLSLSALTPTTINGCTGAAGITDFNGVAKFNVIGTAVGSAQLTATALGANSNIDMAVVTTALRIISPAKTPEPVIPIIGSATSDSVTVTVQTPDSSNVLFASSLGTWDSTASSTVTKTPTCTTTCSVSAVLRSSVSGRGQITASKASDAAIRDGMSVYFYDADAVSTLNATNGQIKVEVAPSSIPVSLNGENQSRIKTTVLKRNSSGVYEPVPGAFVSFALEPSTLAGGGEYLTASLDDTDIAGVAETVFVSGSRASTGAGVEIKASIVGVSGLLGSNFITITNQPGSVVIGSSTKISAINNDTAYQLPMSVLVTDINGGALANTEVSLSIWPDYFWLGCRDVDGLPINCTDLTLASYPNEDLNQNVIRDSGDVVTGVLYPSLPTPPGIPPRKDCGVDGLATPCPLLPPNTAAGSVPSKVVTDSNGIATFNLTYLKEYAEWVGVRVTAKTLVQGTESQGSLSFTLGYLEADRKYLPPSPFNKYFR